MFAPLTVKLLSSPGSYLTIDISCGGQATNAPPVANAGIDQSVLVGDVLKGLIAILLALALQRQGLALGLIGLAAVLGHIYPLYFNFAGGKGVATAVGVLLGMSLWISVIVIAVWLIMAKLYRYSSLAALTAAGSAPLAALLLGKFSYFLPLLLLAALLAYTHQANIQRLRAGTEPKIGEKD